ncbi:MAG TPA: hypothetical protein VFQ61_17890 [Polyangiaceae bacterium]|nr:hypothetical protein [Polyangiaceae bacterium]
MSVLTANTTLRARSGAYSISVSSVDPSAPVNFQIGGQPYDSNRTNDSARLSAGETPSGGAPALTIIMHPSDDQPTQWGQNPIKLVVQAVTSDQGEYTGNSAVLYGYFLGENANGLNFYLDQSQSQANFQFGKAGVNTTIDQSMPAIAVG